MDVVVTGIGFLSCLGSLLSTWKSLLAKESGIKLHQPFPELPPCPLGMIKAQPTNLAAITRYVVATALEDAQLTIPLSQCGVVIGSSRGCQADWEEIINPLKQKKCFSWFDTLPQQPAIAAARYLQTSAPVLSPMAACATGLWAIARGYELIQTGQCSRVIAGAVEAPISPLTLAAFKQMGAMATTGCYPFDHQREGLVLGEGGAILVLETLAAAQERNVPIYGRILGFGFTCDAHHLSSPDFNSSTSAIAVKQCLQYCKLQPQAIDYIQAHGTSTQLNDRHEAQLIKHLFPPTIAVSSTKGATGHTLGASGAMGTALTLMAFKSGYLPPCVGLNNQEFNLNLVTQAQHHNLHYALCFSFGFGGQNAVLALGNPLSL